MRWAFAALLLPGSAFAEGLSVQFEESAPRDRFIFTNESSCALSPMDILIDLRGSAAGLIFDTIPGGAGVNVAQPLVVVSADAETAVAPREDGARDAGLTIGSLPFGGRVVLTLDVDDTEPSGPMGRQMVAGSEIAGAEVKILNGGSGQIGGDGRTVLPVRCNVSS